MRWSRRRLIGAGLGGGGALLAGGFAWDRYATRHRLRFRSLEVVNESDEIAAVTVTVTYGDEEEVRPVDLLPSADGDHDVVRVNGRWISYPETYAVRAERGDQRLELSAAEITDRLDDASWGSDCAHVSIVVTEDGDLESRVADSESC